MNRMIALFSFLLLPFPLFAQTTITGTVRAGTSAGISGAGVTLLDTAGRLLVRSAVTGPDGVFELEGVKPGRYVLHVMGEGYAPYASGTLEVGQTAVSLPAISLRPQERQLREVAVQGQRAPVEVHADKLVVNVEASPVNAGASALEVLSRSPGVTVDANDNVSLKGRQGVNIMVDGRILPLGGTDLATLLRSMPAATIDRIEIISNPSARYDAAGTAGIINIRTRRDKRQGLNGSLSANYGQGVYPKATAGGNLNYRHKKLSGYTNYNYAYRKGFNGLTLTRRFYTGEAFKSPFSRYDQENNSTFPVRNHTFSTGLDYSLGPKTTIGANGNLFFNRFDRTGRIYSLQSDTNGAPVSSFRTANHSDNRLASYSLNANLRHEFDSSGRSLSADVDFAQYQNANLQDIHTYYYLPGGQQVGSPYLLHGDVASLTRIRSVRIDYTQPLGRGVRLDAGVKASYVTVDNNPVFYDVSRPGYYLYDSSKSNHYRYRENINAAYVNAGGEWRGWSVQLGLRAEQTRLNGVQQATDQVMDTVYTKLFPSIALQRRLSKDHDLGITLSRRIERPNYQQLNPFRLYTDPTTYVEGYPYLGPATSYNVELSHTFRKKFITTLTYSHTSDVISQVLLPVPGNITVQTTRNIATLDYYGLSASYPFTIAKWWSNVTNADAWYSRYEGFLANTDLRNGKPAFRINTVNTITLPEGFTLEAGGSYQSAQLYGFMEMKSNIVINLGVQKQLFGRRLTARVNVTDLFWNGYPRASSYYRNYNEDFVAQRDTRMVLLGVTWRFGKNTVAPVKRHSGGAEDEKQRAGNS